MDKPPVKTQSHNCKPQKADQQLESADDKNISAKTQRIYALINEYEEYAKKVKIEHDPQDLFKKLQKRYSGVNHELRSIWSDMAVHSGNDGFEEEIKTIEALLTDFPKRALEDFTLKNGSEVQKKAAMKMLDRMIKSKKELKSSETQTDDISKDEDLCTAQLSNLKKATDQMNREYEMLNKNYSEHLKNEA